MLKKLVLLIVVAGVCAGGWYGWQNYSANQENVLKNHIEKDFSFDSVVRKAKALAAEPYAAPNTNLPAELNNLSYDEHRDIRFVRENGPWYNQNLPYETW